MKPFSMIDLHCDTITLCLEKGKELRQNDIHISLERLPAGSHWCQTYALFMKDELRGADAIAYYERCLAFYREQTEKNGDLTRRVENASEMEAAFGDGKFAALLAVEGGSALAGQLSRVEKLRRDGVRLLTLTWNGPNEIASGSVTDHGFSPVGREIVGEMEDCGIIVDVSHLNDRSFWELCKIAKKPFIATHSNARSRCGHLRNLTDEQFTEIRDRGGIVGMNYYRGFIADGGETSSIQDLIAHITHFLALGGENTLALGSDFDGADIPPYLDGLDRVENLQKALEAQGISQTVIDKIFFENAAAFFKKYL